MDRMDYDLTFDLSPLTSFFSLFLASISLKASFQCLDRGAVQRD